MNDCLVLFRKLKVHASKKEKEKNIYIYIYHQRLNILLLPLYSTFLSVSKFDLGAGLKKFHRYGFFLFFFFPPRGIEVSRRSDPY